MTTLYSHTFALDAYTGTNALPATFNLSGLVTGGATHATVTSVTVMFYKPTQTGTYTMRCSILDPDDVWADYIYEDVEWTGESTQIITFTFPGVDAKIVVGDRFEVKLAKTAGPPRTTYTAHDADDTYFVVEGTWMGVSPIKVKTPAPIDTFTGMTLDYQEFSWVSGSDAPPDEEVYNVYWGTTSGSLTQIVVEGSLTSIAAVYLLGVVGAGLYSETYYWRVDTYWPSTEETADGDEWWFSSISFDPPLPTGVTLTGGDGDEGEPTGTPTGENNMITLKKLVAAAQNKIFYEDL